MPFRVRIIDSGETVEATGTVRRRVGSTHHVCRPCAAGNVDCRCIRRRLFGQCGGTLVLVDRDARWPWRRRSRSRHRRHGADPSSRLSSTTRRHGCGCGAECRGVDASNASTLFYERMLHHHTGIRPIENEPKDRSHGTRTGAQGSRAFQCSSIAGNDV